MLIPIDWKASWMQGGDIILDRIIILKMDILMT